MPNIQVFFKHKVSSIDFDARIMSVKDEEKGQDVPVEFDLCVGADGSYSIVRRQMMRVVRYVNRLSLPDHTPAIFTTGFSSA